MKVITLILVIIGCGLALGALDDVELMKKFQAYTLKHGKNSKSRKNQATRFNTYKKNLNKINEHNKQKQKTYQMEENVFTDLELDDIINSHMGLIINEIDNKQSSNVARSSAQPRVSESIPPSKDWRQTGAITQVKSQGNCGACWAFATTGALEAHHKIINKAPVILSEQHLVNCVQNGCNGGWMNTAFNYVKDNGIPYDSNCTYKGIDQECKSIQRSSVKCLGYEVVPSGDETMMKKVVATKGPVVVAIMVNGNLTRYKSGVFDDSSCGTSVNHGVLVVGYGNEKGKDFWLVKNSWGPGWGEQGYIKMARNKGNQCGIASYASYPLL